VLSVLSCAAAALFAWMWALRAPPSSRGRWKTPREHPRMPAQRARAEVEALQRWAQHRRPRQNARAPTNRPEAQGLSLNAMRVMLDGDNAAMNLLEVQASKRRRGSLTPGHRRGHGTWSTAPPSRSLRRDTTKEAVQGWQSAHPPCAGRAFHDTAMGAAMRKRDLDSVRRRRRRPPLLTATPPPEKVKAPLMTRALDRGAESKG